MSANEDHLIDSLSRSVSVVSIIGCLFIITTFSVFREFRKPMNRLIFFASFGNICSNIATVIATSGIPERGASIALCRFQGFLIQMFMTADVIWAWFMALNVLLSFRGYTSNDMRKLEKWYNLTAYGVPFVPAFVYLILDLKANKGIYGPATLWCWVSNDYEWLRVSFFYGPALFLVVWISVVYGIVGWIIIKSKAAMRAVSRSNPNPSPLIRNPFATGNSSKAVTRVTEIQVTTELRENTLVPDVIKPTCATDSNRSSFGSIQKLSTSHTHSELLTSSSGYVDNLHPYSATISATRFGSLDSDSPADIEMQMQKKKVQVMRKPTSGAQEYFKIATVMFSGLVFIWTPSCANRIYSLAHPNKPPNEALTLMAAFVLPLQGAWNCIVYCAMSHTVCRKAYAELKHRFLLSRMCDMHRESVAHGYHVDCPPFRSCESKTVLNRRPVWQNDERWGLENMTRAEAAVWHQEGNRKGVKKPPGLTPLPLPRTPTGPINSSNMGFMDALEHIDPHDLDSDDDDDDDDDRPSRDEEEVLPLPIPRGPPRARLPKDVAR